MIAAWASWLGTNAMKLVCSSRSASSTTPWYQYSGKNFSNFGEQPPNFRRKRYERGSRLLRLDELVRGQSGAAMRVVLLHLDAKFLDRDRCWYMVVKMNVGTAAQQPRQVTMRAVKRV